MSSEASAKQLPRERMPSGKEKRQSFRDVSPQGAENRRQTPLASTEGTLRRSLDIHRQPSPGYSTRRSHVHRSPTTERFTKYEDHNEPKISMERHRKRRSREMSRSPGENDGRRRSRDTPGERHRRRPSRETSRSPGGVRHRAHSPDDYDHPRRSSSLSPSRYRHTRRSPSLSPARHRHSHRSPSFSPRRPRHRSSSSHSPARRRRANASPRRSSPREHQRYGSASSRGSRSPSRHRHRQSLRSPEGDRSDWRRSLAGDYPTSHHRRASRDYGTSSRRPRNGSRSPGRRRSGSRGRDVFYEDDERYSPASYLKMLAEQRDRRGPRSRRHGPKVTDRERPHQRRKKSTPGPLSLAERIVLAKLDPAHCSIQATGEPELQKALAAAERPSLSEMIRQYRQAEHSEMGLAESEMVKSQSNHSGQEERKTRWSAIHESNKLNAENPLEPSTSVRHVSAKASGWLQQQHETETHRTTENSRLTAKSDEGTSKQNDEESSPPTKDLTQKTLGYTSARGETQQHLNLPLQSKNNPETGQEGETSQDSEHALDRRPHRPGQELEQKHDEKGHEMSESNSSLAMSSETSKRINDGDGDPASTTGLEKPACLRSTLCDERSLHTTAAEQAEGGTDAGRRPLLLPAIVQSEHGETPPSKTKTSDDITAKAKVEVVLSSILSKGDGDISEKEISSIQVNDVGVYRNSQFEQETKNCAESVAVNATCARSTSIDRSASANQAKVKIEPIHARRKSKQSDQQRSSVNASPNSRKNVRLANNRLRETLKTSPQAPENLSTPASLNRGSWSEDTSNGISAASADQTNKSQLEIGHYESDKPDHSLLLDRKGPPDTSTLAQREHALSSKSDSEASLEEDGDEFDEEIERCFINDDGDHADEQNDDVFTDAESDRIYEFIGLTRGRSFTLPEVIYKPAAPAPANAGRRRLFPQRGTYTVQVGSPSTKPAATSLPPLDRRDLAVGNGNLIADDANGVQPVGGQTTARLQLLGPQSTVSVVDCARGTMGCHSDQPKDAAVKLPPISSQGAMVALHRSKFKEESAMSTQGQNHPQGQVRLPDLFLQRWSLQEADCLDADQSSNREGRIRALYDQLRHCNDARMRRHDDALTIRLIPRTSDLHMRIEWCRKHPERGDHSALLRVQYQRCHSLRPRRLSRCQDQSTDTLSRTIGNPDKGGEKISNIKIRELFAETGSTATKQRATAQQFLLLEDQDVMISTLALHLPAGGRLYPDVTWFLAPGLASERCDAGFSAKRRGDRRSRAWRNLQRQCLPKVHVVRALEAKTLYGRMRLPYPSGQKPKMFD